MPEHTPGAMRAAKAIMQGIGPGRCLYNLRQLAKIIDRETAAPELLEALMYLQRQADSMNNRQHAGLDITPADWAELFRFCNLARAAIAKARKGGS